ncbi:MAG: repressor LexA [Firmicutes bacterium]|nr:repressor LexA [Bacillota bacterium]
MRSKSQKLMNEISAYVDQYYNERHTVPSVNEIAKGVGIAKTTSYRYLVAMNDLGMLSYDGPSRTIVTKMISKFSDSTVPAPVVGAIPCGTPEEEEENIQEYVSLPVSLFGKGEFYILKASGDSMVDAGIEDGDLVVIRKQQEASIGDLVVALDESNANTLKKYGGIDAASHAAILLYQNQAKYPDKRILVKELIVQGVARHVIKAL